MADIPSLFDQANQAQQGVVNNMQNATKLPDMLRQAVSEKFKDSPMYGMREQAATNMLNQPSQGRADLAAMGQSGQAILSPTQQNAILTSQRTAAVTPLMALNDLLQMRTGTTEQAIQSGVQGYQSQLQAQQLEAQNLYQQAQDAWQRDMEERKLAQSGSAKAPSVWETLMSQYLSSEGGGIKQDMSGAGAASMMDASGQPIYNEKDPNVLKQLLDMGVASGEITPSAASYLTQGSDEKITFQGITNAANSLISMKNPVNYNKQRALIASLLGKMVESGRMTDQDYQRYLNQLPNYVTALVMPGQAKSQVSNFINTINTVTGSQSSGSDWEIVQ